jgi:hypothetical protein
MILFKHWPHIGHQWQPKAVDYFTKVPARWGVPLSDEGMIGTEALFVCKCGAVKTESLDGRWTLEQLKASVT